MWGGLGPHWPPLTPSLIELPEIENTLLSELSDLVVVVTDLDFFVRPNEQFVVFFLRHFSDDAPHGEVVHVHLVPVVVLHSVEERF